MIIIKVLIIVIIFKIITTTSTIIINYYHYNNSNNNNGNSNDNNDNNKSNNIVIIFRIITATATIIIITVNTLTFQNQLEVATNIVFLFILQKKCFLTMCLYVLALSVVFKKFGNLFQILGATYERLFGLWLVFCNSWFNLNKKVLLAVVLWVAGLNTFIYKGLK